jgi:hypothetical protein
VMFGYVELTDWCAEDCVERSRAANAFRDSA